MVIAASLIAAPAALAAPQQQVKDGSFEESPGAWTFEGKMQRCEVLSPCGPFPASSGNFYAASPTYAEVPPHTEVVFGKVSQELRVPETPATLSFKLREIKELGHLKLLLQVTYNGQVIGQASETATDEVFEAESASIPASLAGTSPGPLQFSVTCINEGSKAESCPRFDFDDVSLTTGSTPVEPPPGGGGSKDTTPPTVKIKSGPGKKLAQGVVKFKFTSNEAGSTFTCKLDNKKSANCRSPKSYSGLKPGRHKFQVWATDAAGNKSPKPAKSSFKIPAS